MTPYYEQDGITIYHGDCREILPTVRADVLVTDPPYGVGFSYASYIDDDVAWATVLEVLTSTVAAMPSAVCMSFARLWEMPRAKWAACWFHPGSTRRSRIGGWSTWEPVLLYGGGWKIANDMIRLPYCVNHTPEASGHPCQKPAKLFEWIISGSPAGVVCDPFMGSGTTLRAAKNLGRQAIGIEIEERYCEIAANRLAQGVLQLERT